MAHLKILDLGLVAYQSAWDEQNKLFQEALNKKKALKTPENVLISCQHKPVFTLGKRADKNHILLSQEELGAEVIRIERGGDVTFHGPGQLVLYPILDLEHYGIGLRQYIFNLEEVIIKTIADFGISGERVDGASGVWLYIGTKKERKICAVGVRASRHVTMHGLAFNINTDLAWFDKIVPCGIPGKGVTSLAKELGKELDFKKVEEQVIAHFKDIFILSTKY